MIFQPKTEQEIIDSKLWAKGEYDFEIIDAFDKDSASGKPMIELKIKLSNGKGISRTIYDHLLVETPEKLRHAAVACQLLAQYESGNISSNDFRGGKRGKLKLGVEKDKARKYPDKNIVLDYLCASGVVSQEQGSGVVLSFNA